MFEVDQIVLNDPALALPLPPFPVTGTALEKGLGKAAELQQVFDIRPRWVVASFVQRKGVQSMIMIPSL
jgi:hypothetical protein